MKPYYRRTLRVGCASAVLVALAGCAVSPPAGPRVTALPGNGKTYDVFTQDDATCRQAAAIQVGPGPSQEQSTNAVVGSAAVGTAVGAVAGAAIGSAGGAVGGGAAVGAGLGLLAGTAIGSDRAYATAGQMQHVYDTVYTQCMMGHGNTVQAPPQIVVYQDGYYPYAPYPFFVGGYYGPRYYHRY